MTAERRWLREKLADVQEKGRRERLRLCMTCGTKPARLRRQDCVDCALKKRRRMATRRGPPTITRCCMTCGEPGHNRQNCAIVPKRSA